MNLTAHTTAIPGCLEIDLPRSIDRRGSFTKIFQSSDFAAVGIALDVRELFVSSSTQCVLRGLHFQLPPHDLGKLVTCLDGEIVDAVVDLRHDSPTFRSHVVTTLHSDRPRAVWVPRGCAHGFFTVSERAVVQYAIDAEHDPELDSGVLWSSAGIAWPTTSPILSDRDASFGALDDLSSPFTMAAGSPR